MTKQTEALKLALEALIGARAFLESDAPVEIWSLNDKAITAITEALAQPEQGEPVAWMQDSIELYVQDHPNQYYTIPLYTTPQQRKPLTDEHIDEIASFYYPRWQGHQGFARAIEAAHGIKGDA